MNGLNQIIKINYTCTLKCLLPGGTFRNCSIIYFMCLYGATCTVMTVVLKYIPTGCGSIFNEDALHFKKMKVCWKMTNVDLV